MTLASRNRKLFWPRIWDCAEVSGILDDIPQSGELIADHVQYVDGECGARLTPFGIALLVAKRTRDHRLEKFFPETLGYATTESELSKELGLKSLRNCVTSISNLDKSHVMEFTNEDGERDWKLSALAAWLVTSMTDSRVSNRENVLKKYIELVP